MLGDGDRVDVAAQLRVVKRGLRISPVDPGKAVFDGLLGGPLCLLDVEIVLDGILLGLRAAVKFAGDPGLGSVSAEPAVLVFFILIKLIVQAHHGTDRAGIREEQNLRHGEPCGAVLGDAVQKNGHGVRIGQRVGGVQREIVDPRECEELQVLADHPFVVRFIIAVHGLAPVAVLRRVGLLESQNVIFKVFARVVSVVDRVYVFLAVHDFRRIEPQPQAVKDAHVFAVAVSVCRAEAVSVVSACRCGHNARLGSRIESVHFINHLLCNDAPAAAQRDDGRGCDREHFHPYFFHSFFSLPIFQIGSCGYAG